MPHHSAVGIDVALECGDGMGDELRAKISGPGAIVLTTYS